MNHSIALLSAVLVIAVTSIAGAGGGVMCPRTDALLKAGRETVRIVAFGDSITGVYYHTGGRRAWCDMLGIALKRIYPKAKLKMINAGISGHTSAMGLARIQRDVLAYKPQLVAVMFGMNDVPGTPAAQFRDNLVEIVERCRDIGAEVVLMTPNSIYPEDPRRPVNRLAEFAHIVRDVGAELNVPVADCYKAYEDVRARNPRAWMLLMSETIHPNMNGHKLFAEEVACVISGRRVSLNDVPPPTPAIPKTLKLLAEGQTAKVIATEPYDKMIGDALRALNPKARVEVTPWPLPHRSLDNVLEFAEKIRGMQPDLVIVALPATVRARTEEQFIRKYSWVLAVSLSFGVQEWDVFGILPSVLTPQLTPSQRSREQLMAEIIRAYDLSAVTRPPGDEASAGEILTRWLRSQAAAAGD